MPQSCTLQTSARCSLQVADQANAIQACVDCHPLRHCRNCISHVSSSGTVTPAHMGDRVAGMMCFTRLFRPARAIELYRMCGTSSMCLHVCCAAAGLSQ